MIYVYFFLNSAVKFSENSVGFEFFMEIAFEMGQILWKNSVRYGMYVIEVSLYMYLYITSTFQIWATQHRNWSYDMQSAQTKINSVIRLYIMYRLSISKQKRHWSDYKDVLADLSLSWQHITDCRGSYVAVQIQASLFVRTIKERYAMYSAL